MERFKDGAEELIDADLDFHMSILGATDNPFLTALGGLIHAALQCAFRYSWEGAARIHDSRLRQHGAILEAIRAGAPDAAREAMRALLSDSLEDVRVFLGEAGRAERQRALAGADSVRRSEDISVSRAVVIWALQASAAAAASRLWRASM